MYIYPFESFTGIDICGTLDNDNIIFAEVYLSVSVSIFLLLVIHADRSELASIVVQLATAVEAMYMINFQGENLRGNNCSKNNNNIITQRFYG